MKEVDCALKGHGGDAMAEDVAKDASDVPSSDEFRERP